VTAVCRAFASARKTSQKPEKTLISEKSPCRRTNNALIRDFFGNYCLSGLLRRFLCLPEHSAKSERIGRLNNQHPEKEEKWLPKGATSELWVARGSFKALRRRTPNCTFSRSNLDIALFTLSLFLSLPPPALFLSLCIVRVSLLTHTHTQAIKKQAFEMAIQSDEIASNEQNPEDIVVEDSYTGPRIEDDGEVTVKFVEGLLAHQKAEKKLHKKYALQILYKVLFLWLWM